MLLSNWILSEYQFLITLPGNGTSKVTVRLILNRTTRTGSFRLCNHLSSLLADSSFVRAQIARRWQPSVQYSIRGTSDGRVLVGGVDQPRRLTRLINHASFFFLSFLFFLRQPRKEVARIYEISFQAVAVSCAHSLGGRRAISSGVHERRSCYA